MSDERDRGTEAVSRVEPDDDRLMAVLAAGEMAPLAELYTRYGAMVRGVIRRHAPEISIAESEELGQDVFLALAKSAGRYERGGRFRAWLFGIAVNKARGWRRSTWLRRNLLRRHQADPSQDLDARGVGPDTDAMRREEIRQALGRLSAAHREVLVLHAVDGFTGEEIAGILGIRPKTVWTRLHRARRAMVSMLAKEEAAALLCEERS